MKQRVTRRRIIFFAEVVTLAHMARVIVLMKALNPEKYEIHFACDNRYKHLMPELSAQFHTIKTISSESFLKALADGQPIYKTKTLIKYVQTDREVIAHVNPDLIIGDFRLSLSISARLANIPYVTITNSYWSIYAEHLYPLPDHVIERIFSAKLGQRLFNLVRPLIFALHCIPMNRARKHFGLVSLGYDLAKVYTDADYVAYADISELANLPDLPSNHFFLGPLVWSPVITLPIWWSEVQALDKPVIYITLGSSGDSDSLPLLLEEIAELPVTVIVTTAGRLSLGRMPDNVYSVDYLSGHDATQLADLVICNGGSMTTQQAMLLGKPVIGIVSNLDQHLNMKTIVLAGSGLLLRAYQAHKKVKDKVRKMLDDEQFAIQSKLLAEQFRLYRPKEQFNIFINQLGL